MRDREESFDSELSEKEETRESEELSGRIIASASVTVPVEGARDLVPFGAEDGEFSVVDMTEMEGE